MHSPNEDVEEILLSSEQIAGRLDTLAGELRRDYADQDLTLVAVLTGSVMFIADLLKRLPIPVRLDYIGVSSYRGLRSSPDDFTLTKALQLDVRGHDVLVVDDILDTGRTLVRIREMIGKLQPRSLRSCVLLEKDVPHDARFQADYVGFHVPDKFVVGYGLDYRERFRNLPYIATLKPEVLATLR